MKKLYKSAFMVVALSVLFAGTTQAQGTSEFRTWHFENPSEVLSDTRITNVNGFWYPERAFFAVVDTLSYSGQNSIAVSYDPAAIGGANANNFRMSLDNVHVQPVPIALISTLPTCQAVCTCTAFRPETSHRLIK